jgi:hypothetical protein
MPHFYKSPRQYMRGKPAYKLPIAFSLWLLMAILWVYLPKYSMTDCALPKGRLAYTTQFLANKALRTCGSMATSLESAAIYFALKTLLSALTGNRNFPSALMFTQFPCLSTPPPGTMQFAPLSPVCSPYCLICKS